MSPEERAARGGRAKRRRRAPDVVVRARRKVAENLERRGMMLIDRAMKKKLVKTPNGPQMSPEFAAGLKLLERAHEIDRWIYRVAPTSTPPEPPDGGKPGDSLDAFRQGKHRAP